MLPAELLRVRRSQGRIHPLYLDANRHLDVARTLIEVFDTHVGSKKGWLESKLEELENGSPDYKLVRGLCSLLFKRCVFRVKPNLAVDPRTARRVVFENASPPPLTEDDRLRVLSQAASQLGVSLQQLEEALWADRDPELILESFTRPDPTALIVEYNSELARTIVAKASRITVFSSPSWKKVFLLAKRCGLMYHASRMEGAIGIVVEGGHYSQNSNAYADRLEAFFQGLLNIRDWSLKAEVPSRNAGFRYLFEMDAAEATRLGFGYMGDQATVPSFDSEVERRFYYGFRALNTGWTITRESEPLMAGDDVFIPDFTLSRGDAKVYVEIVGFWTKDYLERKVRKLSSLKGVDLIVVADASHSSTKVSTLPGVVFFEKDVPLKPILDRLESKHVEQPVDQLPAAEALGDVVDLLTLKKRFGVDYDAKVKALLGAGYVSLGSTLVSKNLFERVTGELKSADKVTYELAEEVCSKFGLSAQEVLKALGYRLKWLGLDYSRVVVEPPT